MFSKPFVDTFYLNFETTTASNVDSSWKLAQDPGLADIRRRAAVYGWARHDNINNNKQLDQDLVDLFTGNSGTAAGGVVSTANHTTS